MRTYYAHIADVLRRYNPQLTVDDIRDEDFLQHDDEEQLLAVIEEVESEFDDLTGNPFREQRYGSVGSPATYDHYGADMYRNQSGIKIWLDTNGITPIDPAKDVVEIRQGKDNWKDITDSEGTRWEMHYRDGWIRVYRRIANTIYRPALRDDFLRLSYRYGAPGGSRQKAGQTTLSSNATTSDTTFDVADEARLPGSGILKVGDEYVRLTSKSSGTLVVERGKRATAASSHSSGEVVHYCPLQIRRAVSARAAQELLRWEDWVLDLAGGDEGFSATQKRDDWQSTWEQVLAKYSAVRSV